MSRLMLALKEVPQQRVDCSPLIPDRLAGMTREEIAALELASGNHRRPVGELFDLAGEDPSDLLILNGCDKLDRIGQGMGHGRISVEGDAGNWLGCAMTGGEIEVTGSAGSFTAAAMKKGAIHVRGNVGDFLAAALPGEPRGMSGGDVIVGGNAGERVGDRMRRGTVLIEGKAGDYCASRMGAGTIAVLGSVGANAGYCMRRGTLLTRRLDGALPSTFNDCGVHRLGFLALLFRSWQGLPGRFGALPLDVPPVRRLVGDLSEGGLGEILVWLE
jgi:formylmethanofuran dehydrogenase subunit C